MGEMKQDDDPKAFLEKYGFTLTKSIPHEKIKGLFLKFTGHEAKYVSDLETKIAQLEKFYNMQNEKIDWLMSRELYLWKKEAQAKGSGE